MNEDATEFVKKSDKCHRHADIHIAPPIELTSLTSTWPFLWWGMDSLGHFPTALGQVKYLVVAVDYFRKSIKVEPLSKITARNVVKFFKKSIMVKFGIPKVLVTYNGTQFIDKNFRQLLVDLFIKHHFTSVELPQTDGQVESVNRVILKRLKRRLDEAKGNWVEGLAMYYGHTEYTPLDNGRVPIQSHLRHRGSHPSRDRRTDMDDRSPKRAPRKCAGSTRRVRPSGRRTKSSFLEGGHDKIEDDSSQEASKSTISF